MFFAVVPAHNEEKRIGSVVRSLFNHVDKVVVVNDGSKDNTAIVAKEAGATVLSHVVNRGQGAALETGHAFARQHDADYVLHFDGDGQFDVCDIAPALAHLKKQKADILFGSRYLDNRSKIPWFKRCVVRPIAKYIVDRPFTGLSLSDSHNGFRILTKHALSCIHITQDGMAHASEIPYLTKTCGLSYVEFPVKVVYYEYGQSSLAGFKIIKDLFVGRFIR
ncbi:MAG: glycosyl transferase [Candidatus Magasanikbacteria bacterium]|nr:glycosyl transferase [Candidatus Magasanikbacteria bacterium]|tara:strand:+ start:3308 stop:3970 length:663 start_codon:yes stop_codon:yes gene_type:complete